MITGLRLKNLRSLVDTQQIDLKRINVLVGMNSSGKSTFLRVFPLLRQSVEARTKGPILWYGRLVDFGSFLEARYTDSSSSSINMSFDVVVPKDSVKSNKRLYVGMNSGYSLPKTVRISMELGRGTSDDVGYISNLNLLIGNDSVVVNYRDHKVKSISINENIFNPEAGHFWYSSPGGMIPELNYFVEKNESGKYYEIDDSWIVKLISSKLHIIAHGNTSEDRLSALASKIKYMPGTDFIKQFYKIPAVPDSLRSGISLYSSDSNFIQELRSLALLGVLPSVINDVSAGLEGFSRGVRYIEPIRASAERYYRMQDFAVDEIDSSGANTAMFLNSLNEHELELLQEWMSEHFDFYVYPERSAGHVAVNIKINNGSNGRNVADLGFGYSQIIPIVLQLWHSCIRYEYYRGPSKEASLIAVEQPELHLHPRYQSLLANVFSAVSNSLKRYDKNVPIVIETHSEHIINKLGALVAEGKIDREDVKIFLFYQNSGITEIKQVEFDSDGVLPESWPIGFFLPEA